MSSPSGADSSGYLVPRREAHGELRERGSRFLAQLVPVEDEATAATALAAIERRHRDATHHCWARRIGWPATERSSDDGEPAGTAGEPILQVLRGSTVSDALLVVTRWYGGTKLGKGGLARAYAGAAREAVGTSILEERIESRRCVVSTSYERLGAVRRLLEGSDVRVLEEDYSAEPRLLLEVELPSLARLEEAMADLGPDVRLTPVK